VAASHSHQRLSKGSRNHTACRLPRPAAPRQQICVTSDIAKRRAGCATSAVDAASSASTPTTQNGQLRVRRAKISDAEAVAELCSEVFGTVGPPAVEVENSNLRALYQNAQENYMVAIVKNLTASLTASLQRKHQAANEARAYRMERRTVLLRRELARLRGEPLPSFPTISVEMDRELRQLRWSRMFMNLITEDVSAAGQHVIGSVTLTVRRVEAVLPPPFPTNAPQRLYVCNMAVSEAYRRRGIARAMLDEAERVGRLWGESMIWIHVESDNEGALGLYRAAGFRMHSTSPWWHPGKQQLLLWKPIPRKENGEDREGEGYVIAGSNGSNGVFEWSLKDEGNEKQDEKGGPDSKEGQEVGGAA